MINRNNHLFPEILAPAGDEAGIRAAINAGADAVYFGGRQFNARQKANNFDDHQMLHVIRLCHQYQIKTYLTLNTLIKDSELDELFSYMAFVSKSGIDGLIVQDPGLIWFLREYYPEISLQTSTQASIGGLFGVLFFQDLGFKRVVLPREMSIEEIVRICRQVDVEIKTFCHGALCYSRSGQCLMSSLIGGRSGNRGYCAQPCRKKYKLFDKNGNLVNSGRLLSMRDFNTRDHLDKIVDAEIDALKIEGRLKSPEYIYAVTKAYREKLDIISGGKDQESITEQDLEQVFSRGFTSGKMFGDDELINPVSQKKHGLSIGKVKDYYNHHLILQLESNKSISVGDGLEFEGMNRGIRVDTLKHKKNEWIIPCHFSVKKGTVVYRNKNNMLDQKISERASRPLPFEPISLFISLKLSCDHPIEFRAEIPNQKIIGKILSVIPVKAAAHPVSHSMLEQQLSKLGDTDYVLTKFQSEIDGDLFLSKSQINAIRREIIFRLESGEDKKVFQIKNPPKRKFSKKILSLEIPSIKRVSDLLELPVDEWVLPCEEYFVSENAMKNAIILLHNKGKKVRLALPKVMNTDLCIKYKKHLDKILKLNPDGFLIRNYEALYLLKDIKISIETDYSMHFFNSMTASAFKQWGITSAVISPELNQSEINLTTSRSEINCTLCVYGFQEVMISDNCLINCKNKHCSQCSISGRYELVDERGKHFPVVKDKSGMIHIYNGDKLFIKEELKHLPSIKNWRIRVLDENFEELNLVVQGYRNGCQWDEKKLYRCYGRYTKGNFHRGVI